MFLGANSDNPLEALPTKLSLSTRTSDFAMNNPAKANHPISNSLNVMGPNPLVYPQGYQPDEDSRPAFRDSQQQTESFSSSYESSSGVRSNPPNDRLFVDADVNALIERPQDLSRNREDVFNSNLSRPQIIVSARKSEASESTSQEQVNIDCIKLLHFLNILFCLVFWFTVWSFTPGRF